MPIDDTDKFEEKEMKKIRPLKNTWYDWLINYISESTTKMLVVIKIKLLSLFNTTPFKQTGYGRGEKLSKSKTAKQSEENKNNSIRNHLILKKEKKKRNYRIIRDIWTLFETEEKKEKKLKKKKEINDRLIGDRKIRDIRTFFEQEDHGDYFNPKRVSNFWKINYIEYENNGDRNINLSLYEHLDKIKPYLRDISIDLQESNTWKIQLTIAITFISSKDAEEEHVMHSERNNIKFTSSNDAKLLINSAIHLIQDKKVI